MNKPKIEEIKYMGMMMGQNAWGNDDAQKIIDWYKARLEEEMEKNLHLDHQNFKNECRLIVARRRWWKPKIKHIT